jgi:hypothetical protein
MRVDVRRRAGETRLEDADRSNVGERVIPALAVAQRLTGAAAFRDVVRHAQQPGDLPVQIAQRHCLRLEPAPGAVQADHLELSVPLSPCMTFRCRTRRPRDTQAR